MTVRFIGGPKDGEKLELRLPIPTEIELPVYAETGRPLISMALYRARLVPGLLPGTLDFDAFVYLESRPPAKGAQ